MLKIYAKDTTKMNEEYFIMKEYRSDILVEIKNCFYEINCYTSFLLKQESDDEGNKFINIPNLFIVKDVKFNSIIESILSNYEHKYFDYLKQVANINISEWYEVYPNRTFIEFKKQKNHFKKRKPYIDKNELIHVKQTVIKIK